MPQKAGRALLKSSAPLPLWRCQGHHPTSELNTLESLRTPLKHSVVCRKPRRTWCKEPPRQLESVQLAFLQSPRTGCSDCLSCEIVECQVICYAVELPANLVLLRRRPCVYPGRTFPCYGCLKVLKRPKATLPSKLACTYIPVTDAGIFGRLAQFEDAVLSLAVPWRCV